MSEETRNEAPEQELSEILQIRREKLAALQEEGRDPFKLTRFVRSAWSSEIKDGYEQFEGKTVQAAGRIMSKRGMGKAIFCHIKDDRGQIQLYVRSDAVTAQEFADFRKYDIGDIIGVSGYVFKTKTGETSIHVEAVTLLSKGLRPLPEKFHGMTNVELKYRQRYVDLIMSDESRRNFEIRSRFVSYVRRFLEGRGFMEVETPVLNTISGGATARPFITHHNALDIDMYMRIATELHLKRLIVGGMERVYEIGRIFRNEGMDTQAQPGVHHRRAIPGLRGLQRHDGPLRGPALRRGDGDTRHLRGRLAGRAYLPCPRLAANDHGRGRQEVPGHRLHGHRRATPRPWRRPRPRAWIWTAWSPPGATRSTSATTRRSRSCMIQPTFITMHPVDVSPLAKRSPKDPRLTERFELFICRSEMGNAFSELNDPIDQQPAL